MIHVLPRKEVDEEHMMLWQALLLPRLNPWKMVSRYLPCQYSVSPNATKLRQSDLTSYFTVSGLWEALPNRDTTKFTRGTSILQYLMEMAQGSAQRDNKLGVGKVPGKATATAGAVSSKGKGP